jgi:hypothetical protein
MMIDATRLQSAPTAGRSIRVLALALAVACCAVAGCSRHAVPTPEDMHADWSVRVHRAIADPARAERVTALARQLVDGQQTLARDLSATADRMAALNTDHAASKEAYLALYEEFASRQRVAQLNLKDQILAMRRETSAEEWKAITR